MKLPQVSCSTLRDLPQLVTSLQNLSSPAAMERAAHALFAMATNPECREPIAQAALPELISLLQDPAAPRGRDLAAGALANLAADASLRQDLATAALPGLADMLEHSATPQGASYALEALRQLVAEPALTAAVADAALPALVSLLQGGAQASQQELALAVIWQLAAEPALAKRIAVAALSALVSLLQVTSSPPCSTLALAIIVRLADKPGSRQCVANAALPALVSFLEAGSPHSENDEGQNCAALIICTLSLCPTLQPAIAATALPVLGALLAAASARVRTTAVYAVYELTCAPALQQAVADAALPGLVSLLQTCADPTAQEVAAAALGRLAKGSQQLQSQIKLQASHVLQHVAQLPDRAVASNAAKAALCSLRTSPVRIRLLQMRHWWTLALLAAVLPLLQGSYASQFSVLDPRWGALLIISIFGCQLWLLGMGLGAQCQGSRNC